MKSTPEIRKAATRDASALKDCMESAYTPYLETMGGARLPPMDVDYLSEINDYPTWVVEDGGGILGGLIMVFDDDQASIANIAVDPKYQGKGIGGKLMRFAESSVKDKGFTEIQLATHVLLEENISLYQHLGWEETGRDNIRIIMTKKL